MSSSYSTLINFIVYIECILLIHSSLLHAAHLPIDTPGEVTPCPAHIEVGGSADIECRMNPDIFTGKNSSFLYFVEADTKRRVPSSDIAIVDETAIVYMIRNATKQDREYHCKIAEHKGGVAIAHVYVGTKPIDVNDFKCRGYDYTYMVCNFTAPENEIKVQYQLSYTAHDQNYKQPCDLEVEEQQRICNLTTSKGNYRVSYEFYNFTLIGTNALGMNKQHFWINHFESVIPARPEFSCKEITTNSVVLSWHLDMFSYYKSKGLQYEIRLRPKHFDWVDISNYEKSNRTKRYNVTLRNLEYAYYDYTVRMRLKVKTAHSDDTMWSEPYERTFRTKARVPDHPPRTDVGSFYIDPSERVRLYWHELPEYRHNGAHFHYVVKEVNRDGVTINSSIPISHSRIPAIFEWNENHRYEFIISSRNDEGESIGSSQIVVPPMPKKYREERSPKWIRNVYHDSNKTYTLSWSAPIDQANLKDYTVFWCRLKPRILNECEDTIRFKRISKRESKYTTERQEQENTLNFAVSANYDDDYSSGMYWTMCTAEVSSDLIKMEPEITALSGSVIKVQWNIDRICISVLEGYKLSYCRVDNATNGQCVGNHDITIDKSVNKYLLSKLKPHSTYKIKMYMFSNVKQGIPSDVKYVDTEQEASTRPRALKLHNITTNSAWISWQPPTELNGILRQYIVVLNNERQPINCTAGGPDNPCNTNNTNKEINYKLENLSSFTSYKVYVIAYTVKESRPSNDIHFKTLIGIPSNPRYMAEIDPTSTTLTMKWSKPDVPSGHVDFYEVAVIVWRNDEIVRQRISGVIGSTSCIMAIPTCADANFKTTVQVRAVNVVAHGDEIDPQIFSVNSTGEDPDEKFYTGNDDLKCTGTAGTVSEYEQLKNITRYVQYKSAWEKGPNYGCARNQNAQFLVYPLVAIVAGLVVWLFFPLRKKYIKMSTINITLPGGLDDYPIKGSISGGIDNGISIEKDDEFLHHQIGGDCNKESIYTNYENHRLLSAACNNDSGYLLRRGGGEGAEEVKDAGRASHLGIIGKGGGGVTTTTHDKSSIYVGSDRSADFIEHDVLATKPELNHAANDAYMVMERLKPTNINQQQKLPATTLIMPTNADLQPVRNNGYVYPCGPMSSSIIPAENGYIKPSKSQMFNVWQQDPRATATTPFGAVSRSGYVAATCLPKTTTIPAVVKSSLDGYTTFKALVGRHQMPATFDSPNKDMQSVSTTSPTHIFNDDILPISGYVTQKELSAMGQHRMS